MTNFGEKTINIDVYNKYMERRKLLQISGIAAGTGLIPSTAMAREDGEGDQGNNRRSKQGIKITIESRVVDDSSIINKLVNHIDEVNKEKRKYYNKTVSGKESIKYYSSPFPQEEFIMDDGEIYLCESIENGKENTEDLHITSVREGGGDEIVKFDNMPKGDKDSFVHALRSNKMGDMDPVLVSSSKEFRKLGKYDAVDYRGEKFKIQYDEIKINAPRYKSKVKKFADSRSEFVDNAILDTKELNNDSRRLLNYIVNKGKYETEYKHWNGDGKDRNTHSTELKNMTKKVWGVKNGELYSTSAYVVHEDEKYGMDISFEGGCA